MKKPENMVGPTIGHLDILADESLRYIIEQEEDIFEKTYKYADIEIHYLPEYDLFKRFMTDTFKSAIISRALTGDERQYFITNGVTPREYAFATSALAFITNENPKDTAFTYEQILELWNNTESGKIFVIENAKSGIAYEVMRLLNTTNLPSHFYALKDKKEVIQYLQAHDNAIGIVDWSDISDSDNPDAKNILSGVNLLGISRPVDSIQNGFIKPYQYNLQDRQYPLTRDLYFISTTGMSDVGMGFATFIAAEIGQKIILKAGLLPKYQFERIIEMGSTKDIKVVK
ncbi:MAG: substrate-binding domain-containing protein [Bacteroidota bacterium]|nr:substrate-binding domain-containing protein [Bacteroidota bacterium]